MPIVETNSSSPYSPAAPPYFNQNQPVYQQPPLQQVGTPQNPVEIGGPTHIVPTYNREGNAVYEAQG